MSPVSVNDIKKSLPSKKKDRDKMDIWVYYIVRPISYYFTWVCLKLGITAAGATYLSMVIGLIGPLLLLESNYYIQLLGVLLINSWIVFDCVDGNIARFKNKTSLFGKFIDGVSGYIIMSSLYLCIGASVYLNSEVSLLENQMWVYLFIGAIGSISTLFPRIIEHKATTMFSNYNSDITNKETYNFLYTIAFNIGGIAGLSLPLLLLSYVFNVEHIYILFYGLFHFLVAVYSSFKTINYLRKHSA